MREPLRVEREAGEFVRDDPQPLAEPVGPGNDGSQLLLYVRSPRKAGLCFRACPIGCFKCLRIRLETLPDLRVEPEPGDLRLDILLAGEVTLDLGDEPSPLLLEGGEAAARAPEGIGRRPLPLDIPDPLPEGGVRSLVVPVHAERPDCGTVLACLGLPALHDTCALLVPGRGEGVLLFQAPEDGEVLLEVGKLGGEGLVFDGPPRMLVLEVCKRRLHRCSGGGEVLDQLLVVSAEALAARRAGSFRARREDIRPVPGEPPDLFTKRFLAFGACAGS